ncbi:hypothetical protein BTVI_09456 [Pitangus sulphuratus]|nr:hypothetical protein BTVI_09456 [Pitangus sulphuratus]
MAFVVAVLDMGIQSPLESSFDWCLAQMVGADSADSMDTCWTGEVTKAFLDEPPETWATTEKAALRAGKRLGSTLVIDVLCNLGQVTECLMDVLPFWLRFWLLCGGFGGHLVCVRALIKLVGITLAVMTTISAVGTSSEGHHMRGEIAVIYSFAGIFVQQCSDGDQGQEAAVFLPHGIRGVQGSGLGPA